MRGFSFTLAFLLLLQEFGCEVPTTPDDVCEASPKNEKANHQISADSCEESKKSSKTHPDVGKTTGQIFETYHYPHEIHNVTSKDGYILTVFRITGSPNRNDSAGARKRAVFLQHGMGCASDSWNFQPGNRNLPFKLADAGYEVWIGNARGTSYSSGHTKYNSSNDLSYWNYSWHEMGIYDLPAIVDKILQERGNQKIIYIAHSMGSTMYFVGLSEIPELNDKIHAGFFMSPIAYIGHMPNNMRLSFGLVNTDFMFLLANMAVQGRFQFDDTFRATLKSSFGSLCDTSTTKCGICDNIVFMMFGFDGPQINMTEIPNIMSRIPNTVNVKTMAHYAQCASTCTFRKYNFGEYENQKMYNSSEPPDYKLENIKSPTYFIYGDNDDIGAPNDVKITAKKFSKGVIKSLYRVPHDLFNHADFLFAKDADMLVYNYILKEMEKYK